MTDADWEFFKKRWQEAKNGFLTDAMRPDFEDLERRGLLLRTHIYRGIIRDNEETDPGRSGS